MPHETNLNQDLDDFEPPESGIEPPPERQRYTPPTFLRWRATGKTAWIPKPGETECSICPMSKWSRDRVTNRLDQNEESEEATQAFCRVKHCLTYTSADPNQGADGDYTISCDGPHRRWD